jgi:hypothetical protein
VKYLFALILLCYSSISALASEYPMTRGERKAEEMGSALGGEGIVFRPSKIAKTSTSTGEKATNTYLWEAALEILDFAPLSIKNQDRGIISTDWNSDKSNPNITSKITVTITSNVISPESIIVVYKQKILKNGSWVEDDAPKAKSIEIEAKIIRRARELYQKSS